MIDWLISGVIDWLICFAATAAAVRLRWDCRGDCRGNNSL